MPSQNIESFCATDVQLREYYYATNGPGNEKKDSTYKDFIEPACGEGAFCL
jgi:hypothetical protein